MNQAALSELTDYQQLIAQLASRGAVAAIEKDDPAEIQRLLTEGQFWARADAELIPGRITRPHSNAAKTWASHRSDCSIATGYALDYDGSWQQHSWLVRRSGALLETTHLHQAYYGRLLDSAAAESFFYQHA